MCIRDSTTPARLAEKRVEGRSRLSLRTDIRTYIRIPFFNKIMPVSVHNVNIRETVENKKKLKVNVSIIAKSKGKVCEIE